MTEHSPSYPKTDDEYSNDKIASRLMQTFIATGDRWFKIAAIRISTVAVAQAPAYPGSDGLMIYEQCAQIVRSYGPPCDENMRAGLLAAIEHFKGLYERELSAGATADKPALGVLGSLPSGESDPLVTTDSTGAGPVAQSALKLCWARPLGATMDSMRRHVLETGLADLGDTILVWVNEGDFWMLALNGCEMKEYKNPDGPALSSTDPRCTCAAIVNPNIPHARSCPLSSTNETGAA